MKKSLYIENGSIGEFTLQAEILGFNLGPKALTKYLKKVDYSYTLIGPHKQRTVGIGFESVVVFR